MQYDSTTYAIGQRYFFSLNVGALVTVLLLALMQMAVQNDQPELSQPTPSLPVNWVLLPEEPDPVDEVAPIKRETEPPPPIPRQFQWPADDSQSGYHHPLPQEPVPIPTGLMSADGDLVPYMTGPPDYPARAAQRGIEGWVLVEFTVTETGRVVAPRVVDAYPGSVFNKAALKAVQRYKYKPRVVHGAAIAVHGVKQRIVFSMTAG